MRVLIVGTGDEEVKALLTALQRSQVQTTAVYIDDGTSDPSAFLDEAAKIPEQAWDRLTALNERLACEKVVMMGYAYPRGVGKSRFLEALKAATAGVTPMPATPKRERAQWKSEVHTWKGKSR